MGLLFRAVVAGCMTVCACLYSMPVHVCSAGVGTGYDTVSIDACDDFGAITGSICQEGGGHVLLVTGGTSKAAVAAVTAQAIPAANSCSHLHAF